MKKYLPYFFLLVLLVAMSSSKVITLFTKDVFTAFSYSLLPTLAPSIFLDYLFINSGGLETIYNFLLKRFKNTKVIYRHLIVILGLISGTPTLANYVHDSINKNYLSKKEGEVILSSFILPSFPFIYGVIIPKLNSIQIIVLLFLLYAPSSLYYLFSLKNENQNIEVSFIKSEGNYLHKSIMDTAKTLLILIGTILLFSLPFPLLNMFFNKDISYTILGFFEFTSSSLYIVNNLSSTLFFILVCILSFSSCSVYSQISILCPSISIKKILKKRFLFLGINVLIIGILFIFKIL